MRLRFSKILFILMIVTLLSGCSLLDGINNSMGYVDRTTTYIHDTSEFAEKIQTFSEKSLAELSTVNALKQELEMMKEKIIDYNGIEAPLLAKTIHKELVSYNETLLNEINRFLDNIKAEVHMESIKNSQIFQTIKKITDIQQSIEKLSL